MESNVVGIRHDGIWIILSEDLGANFFSICLGTRLLSAIRRFPARNDDSSPSHWVPSWRIDKAGGFFSSEPPLSRVSLGSFFLLPPSSFFLLLLLDDMVCLVVNDLKGEENGINGRWWFMTQNPIYLYRFHSYRYARVWKAFSLNMDAQNNHSQCHRQTSTRMRVF